MEQTLPSTCRVKFEDPHQLHDFYLTVTPDEGYWAGGRFRFHIFVTEDYNMAVCYICFPMDEIMFVDEYASSVLSLLGFINITAYFQPPSVKCLTKLWHPNISEDGDICLSLLRQNSIDGMGWAPTRKLKDIVWGLNSLFTVSTKQGFFFVR